MDHVAAAAAVARRDHCSRGDGDNRRADRRRVINAEMRSIRPEHRVQSILRKAGRDSRLELQRRAQEESFEGSSLIVVESRFTAGRIDPPEGAKMAAVGDEPRTEDSAITGELPVVTRLLHEDVE